MQKFDEVFITTYNDNMKWAQLANQGAHSIWVGFAEDYLTGTYWVFNPNAKNNNLPKDVTS